MWESDRVILIKFINKTGLKTGFYRDSLSRFQTGLESEIWI